MWGAEIGQGLPMVLPGDSTGFNGAAPCGARKYEQTEKELAELRAASTGPRLVGRGNPREPAGRRPQWSRFNGAAPCGARKSTAGICRSDTHLKLQRGRALWGAEIKTGRTESNEHSRASTGPRLVGRGNCLSLWRRSGRCSRLQRGRALWGAEIFRRCHPFPSR